MESALEEVGLDDVRQISSHVYDTTDGKVFVKRGGNPVGELESLKRIQATSSVRIPVPIGVCHVAGEDCLVTSFIEEGRKTTKAEMELAADMARMHLFDSGQRHFGFPMETCCGAIAQKNDWADDWTTFFIRNRLNAQIELLEEKGVRDLRDVKDHLYKRTEQLLRGRHVRPAILHGDLWAGNWMVEDGHPVIYDPSSFYGDPEFEQGIMNLFGSYGTKFWAEYGRHLPLDDGREARVRLYELYHLLNHWNLFGTAYRTQTMKKIEEIIHE